MSVRRDMPRHMTVLPGRGPLARARWPPSRAILVPKRKTPLRPASVEQRSSTVVADCGGYERGLTGVR